MELIQTEWAGAVRTITLARPEKRNALNPLMLTELHEAFSNGPSQEERVIVIRAQGPAFCSGLDLKDRITTLGQPGASSIETVLHAIENYPLPVVAVVQGDAIAGGNELALHCDFVIASREARFGMSLAQIGLAPTWFLTKKLLETAGPVTTREILLLGDPLSATRMHELGVIARVAPAEKLDASAAQIIDRLAKNAPLSLRSMKALLVREMAFRDNIEHADIDAMVQQARESTDARKGIQARLDRRPPEFSGH
jgi:enoyl-CoA hydratase/carnithine racemase